jgi:hypothetical protein
MNILIVVVIIIIIIIIISDVDICNTIKRLKLSKSVGLDDISGVFMKGFSFIFIPILKHIFNLNLTQQYFPAVRGLLYSYLTEEVMPL